VLDPLHGHRGPRTVDGDPAAIWLIHKLQSHVIASLVVRVRTPAGVILHGERVMINRMWRLSIGKTTS
jgi:hypothetical protein